MARHLLSARQVQTAAIGDHQDGDGLFLRVQPGAGGKLRASWVLRYTAPGGKRRELGLGGAGLAPAPLGRNRDWCEQLAQRK